MRFLSNYQAGIRGVGQSGGEGVIREDNGHQIESQRSEREGLDSFLCLRVLGPPKGDCSGVG